MSSKFPTGIPAYGIDCFRMAIMLGCDHETPLKTDLKMFDRSRAFITKYANFIRFSHDLFQKWSLNIIDESSFEIQGLNCDGLAINENHLIEISTFFELQSIAEKTKVRLDRYGLHSAASNLESFIFDNICSQYLEYLKILLRSNEHDACHVSSNHDEIFEITIKCIRNMLD